MRNQLCLLPYIPCIVSLFFAIVIQYTFPEQEKPWMNYNIVTGQEAFLSMAKKTEILYFYTNTGQAYSKLVQCNTILQ